jgi:hypothetical protein
MTYMFPVVETLPLSNIHLVNFGFGCSAAAYGFKDVLIFRPKTQDILVIGIPEDMAPGFRFMGLERKLSIPLDFDSKEFLSRSKGNLAEYIKSSGKYYLVPIQYFEQRIFEMAAEISGFHRAPNDLNGAIEDLARQTQISAVLLGVPTRVRIFVILSPIFVFGLVFLLHHRLRFIRRHDVTTAEAWILLDARTFDERTARIVYSCIPAATVTVVFLSYSLVMGTLAVETPFGIVNVPELFGVKFYEPATAAFTIEGIDVYATALLFLYGIALFLSIRSYGLMLGLSKHEAVD